MKLIIDRFEGDYAVVELENKKMINVPKDILPEGACEGSVIAIVIDESETTKRRNNIKKLMGDLWN